jgi:D-alanine-D-alanine ligase
MKKKVAFITGGYSSEAQVSYRSAETIVANIDKDKYDAFKIDIRKDGWWYPTSEGLEIPVDKNDFSISLHGEKIKFDVALIGIHGTPGEDGKLQGYFDMIGLPYNTCDATTSAITFNKRFAVSVAAFSGISVARSLHFYKGDEVNIREIAASLSFPLFVKPANGGSSIGMSKVPDATLLAEAIEKAFGEDDQVLIEEFVDGREFTVGVCRLAGVLHVLPLTEVFSENYFFDYEAKYHGKSRETTPAEVDESIAEQIRDEAKKIYNVFNCRGVVRIDFIYNEEKGKPYMLEINTVPGQSAASVVPQQVRALGWHLKDFYAGLIDAALEP